MLNCDKLFFSYRDLPILQNFSSTFPAGKHYTVLGPSGCGKSTLLRLVAGVLTPDRGQLKSSRCSFLFQNPRLMPCRSVYMNLEIPLLKFLEKGERRQRIEEMLEQLGLADWAESFPAELSGGMQQRCAMGRAFLYPSDILLMDEPFLGQDPLLKRKLIALLKEQLHRYPRTLIAVTHQVDEALMLGDEIRIYTGLPLKELKRWDNPLKAEQRIPGSQEFAVFESTLMSAMLSLADASEDSTVS